MQIELMVGESGSVLFGGQLLPFPVVCRWRKKEGRIGEKGEGERGETLKLESRTNYLSPFPLFFFVQIHIVDATNGGLWGKVVHASISPHDQIDDPLSPYHAILVCTRGEETEEIKQKGI